MANNPTTRLQQWARFLEAKGWLSSTALPGIVGTVSQTGGVATGAVVERGSNANGNFVKFADGTMICWGIAAASVITTTAASPLYRAIPPVLTFPVTFVGDFPHVSAGGQHIAGTQGWVTTLSATLTGCQIRIWSIAADTEYKPAYVAVGRWF